MLCWLWRHELRIVHEDNKVRKIRLIGDHTAYHCGSAAVLRAIRAAPEKAGRVVGRDEEYNLRLVNGEGSMHHNDIGFQKMYEIRDALERGDG